MQFLLVDPPAAVFCVVVEEMEDLGEVTPMAFMQMEAAVLEDILEMVGRVVEVKIQEMVQQDLVVVVEVVTVAQKLDRVEDMVVVLGFMDKVLMALVGAAPEVLTPVEVLGEQLDLVKVCHQLTEIQEL
jgi:hypothetical protein